MRCEEVTHMEKYSATPVNYMKVGELAKKVGVTTRALRFYDKEGLLSPQATSESGYRLYTDKDMVRLIQILMLKQLGFPLSEIKNKISAMDTTADVVEALTIHATKIRSQIDHLTESLNALESLKDEIIQVDAVDYKKFAAILESIYMKNERYWLVKYLDNDILDELMRHNTEETAIEFVAITNDMIAESAKLQEEGVHPRSKKGQDFAKKFWEVLMEFTGGDMDLVFKISEQMAQSTSDKMHDETMEKSREFMSSALETYLSKPEREGADD